MSDTGLEVSTVLKARNPGHYASGFYSSGIKNGFAAQVGATYQYNVGFKDHSGNNGATAYYALGLFKKNNIFKLYGVSGIIHNNLAFYGVSKDLIDSNYRTNLNATSDKDTFNQNLVCLNWINYANTNRKFNTSIYFNNVNGTYNTANILFGVTSYQVGLMSNMVLTNGKNTTNIGVNANIYSRKHFGSDNGGYYDYPQNCQYYTNTGHKQDVIGYVKGITDGKYTSFFYDLQVRSVWFNATDTKTYNWLFLNPKIGVKTKSGHNNIYINFGITQREPTRTDMIQNIIQSDSAYRFGNPDNTKFLANDSVKLHPERVFDFEAGNQYKTEYLDVNINAYLMAIQNEYVATGNIDPFSGFMVKKAVDGTLRYGIESNIKVKMNHFNVFFNSQFQCNRLMVASANPQSIPFTPNFISSVGITYTAKTFTVGVVEQTISSMAMNLGDQQYMSSAYQLTNAFVDYRFKNAIVSFKVNNLFNDKYYIPAGVAGVPTYYVGDWFGYSLSLKVKF